jgi:predicted cupin superfamily sugar epimerase
MSLTVDEIKRLLNLQPHPTCGFFAESYVSAMELPGSALPPTYGGSRSLASALYFLVSAERHMEIHRLRADQMYHHYLGDPLEVLLLYADGHGEVQTIGTDLAAGQRPQLLVPGGTFHVSRVQPGGSFAFMGTTAWPAPHPPDFELGDPARLTAAYPALREQIQAFTQ